MFNKRFTFWRGSGKPSLHSGVLDPLYPRSWLMRSHRYCVARGPCRPSETIVRIKTGSTVIHAQHERHELAGQVGRGAGLLRSAAP